jgi:hypothetical protein
MKSAWPVVPILVFLAGCDITAPPEPVARQPQRLEAANSAALAGHVVAADAAAALGDRKAAQANMEAAQDDVRKSMKLPDPRRKIDHELARAAAKRVDAVRSAVWLDSENLFVIVKENAQRSQQTIDQICIELEPLGDTLGVVVNVQSGAATSGDDLEILSRNCQLDPGERALLQKNRQVDVLSPSVRAEQKANNGR